MLKISLKNSLYIYLTLYQENLLGTYKSELKSSYQCFHWKGKQEKECVFRICLYYSTEYNHLVCTGFEK